MKYIMYWEYDPENHDKVIEKLKKFREAIKKNPDKFPKFISKNYASIDGPKGFQLIETDNEEHLANFSAYYMPEVRLAFETIIEVSKSLELFKKLYD